MTRAGFLLNGVSIIIVAFAVFLYNRSTEKKIAYVKISKLYEDFQMKKQMEAKYNEVEKFRKNMLDSLELELQLLSKKLDEPKIANDKNQVLAFEEKREKYLAKKNQFEEDNHAMATSYTEQIMKQMNQYVQNYGKENHYTYILGAEGSGVIMHADDACDITESVLKYINTKYKGL